MTPTDIAGLAQAAYWGAVAIIGAALLATFAAATVPIR